MLLSAWLLLAAPPASAASYDPELTWQTLRTEHFKITFHDGLEQLAEELGQLCDGVYDKVSPRIGTELERPVELVLVDHTDSANGYATPLPVNTIVIFVTAPQESGTLNLYADWNEAILTHELTHILHLDTVEGLPRVLRLVLGRIVSVNQLSPGWIIEGLATWQETELTAGGRGRASQADMIKRMTVLEDHFPPLGNLDGFQSDPPYGNLRYLFGQDFVDYIADTTGQDKWKEWIHTYGRQVVPYIMPARKVFGQPYRELYLGWKAATEQRYGAVKAQVEAEGVRQGVLVSDGDSACSGPRFSPDGQQLVYGCNHRKRGPAIWLAQADGSQPDKIYSEASPHNFAWRPDSQAFVFPSSHAYDLYYTFEDLYLFELESEQIELLTERARGRDPEFSPDGRELLAVVNEAQNNDLARFTVAGQATTLTHHRDHTQLSTPRFSPDGRWLALSVWRDGQRDLWLATPEGALVRQLTDDQAIDREPAWHPDGRTLFFVSDRSGISNIYAVDLQSLRLWQVTNVLGGAFQPDVHPAGATLAYAEYTWNGEDIRLLEIDRGQWMERGELTGSWSAQGLLASPAPVEDAAAELDPDAEPPEFSYSHPVSPYSPWSTLVPPRYMMPGIYVAEYGLLGYLGTGGADTLRRWLYSAYLTYRTDNRFLGGGGALVYNRWRTSLSAGGSLSTIRYGQIYVDPGAPDEGGAFIPGIEKGDTYYYDKRTRSWLQATYPLGHRHYVFARYNGQLRQSLYELDEQTYLGTLPTRGFLSTFGGGWRYHKTRAYAHSISPEDSRTISLVGEGTSRYLGAYTLDDLGEREPFDQVQLSAEWREYTTMPWLGNHVLALRGAVGLSMGDNLRYGSFRLGGSYGEGALYVLPEEYRSLRGFPVAAVYGDWYYLSSLEYRAPLWRIDRGAGTLPLFVRTLHGAVYADAGYAFDELPASGAEAGSLFSSSLVGVGAELRLGMVLGYGLGLTTRLGYGFAVNGDNGYVLGSLDGFYAQLGSSF